ncbi:MULTISPECIES: endonuclease/exonuclease/phosphatase family protein [Gracilibacillus]|uniref:endonuclease/exonuclease/phosphatase family protein n=1 Tax=Gracilibacillus TaxID=74385 RepID=UPI00098FC316|nr:MULTISPECIES: endonuclease/exonuclease/phosphatase family protein [Gracilibacillus]
MRNRLVVMSYNIRNDSPVDHPSWSERKEHVGQLIIRESPDLLGLQECLFHQITDLESLLPGYQWIGFGREGGSKGEYTPIFYKKDRLEVRAYQHFWLSDFPDQIGSKTWGNQITRIATWVLFRDKQTNKDFYHLNTHFDHETELARINSAQLIGKPDEIGLQASIPLILTGDFNASDQSETHQHLIEAGFVDTWETSDHHENKQYGSFNDFHDATGGKTRIDWILLKEANFQVLTTKLVVDQIAGHFPSDHFPITVELEV